LFAPLSPAFAQDIIINTPVVGDGYGNVYGNGQGPDYAEPNPVPDSAVGNSVTVVAGGKVVGAAHGGYAAEADTAAATATGNRVDVNGGTIGGAIGGRAFGNGYSGAITLEATGNTVTVNSDAAPMTAFGGMITGVALSSATARANNNIVEINAKSAPGMVWGGWIFGVNGPGSVVGAADGNRVAVVAESGAITTAIGAYVVITGVNDSLAAATNNSVHISGGVDIGNV
jgi:hypothetical protein